MAMEGNVLDWIPFLKHAYKYLEEEAQLTGIKLVNEEWIMPNPTSLFDTATALMHQENAADIVYPIYLGTTYVTLEPWFQRVYKNIKNSQNRAH